MRVMSDNKRVSLGGRLGRGGEGEVHEIVGEPSLAAKLYHQPDRKHEAKVAALISASLASACPAVAFPRAIIRHDDGRFAGFVMPKVAGRAPIHELLGIGSMKRFFPHANWAFLVRVALNFAKAVASVHAAGVIIGDINSAGVLVGQDARVTLIDADSFQFRQFGCRVGMPEYTPPELQGASLGDVTRTVDHDAFGLAVLIFQILALGRHPYAGVHRTGAMPPAEGIAQHRFAYSLLRQTGLKPPHHALQFGDFPLGIRTLFERAFAPTAGARPSAAEWSAELAVLERGLARCAARSDHIVASLALPCPWCRLERGRTTRLFPARRSSQPQDAAPSSPLYVKVRKAIARAKVSAGETVQPAVLPVQARPSAAARSALMQCGPIHATTFSVSQLATFCGGPHRKLAAAYVQAEAAVARAIADWRTRIGVWDTYRKCSELEDKVRQLKLLAGRRAHAEAQEFERVVQHDAMALLRSKMIANAQIPGISRGLCSRLASIGAVSAADLFRIDIASLSGIGAARMFGLLLWRDSCAAKAQSILRGDPLSATAASASAKRRYLERMATIEAEIEQALCALDMHVSLVRSAVSSNDAAVTQAYAQMDQAVCDLQCLGYNPLKPKRT